jgi:hypothetical protein
MDSSRMQGKRQVAPRRPLGTIFGFAFIVFYISFTIIAIAQFPRTVSPLDMYLSTLGNADISPDGAIFYSSGVILSGLAEILFFIAIYSHYSQYGRRWILIVGLVAGIINGISVLMSGVYPEHAIEIIDMTNTNVSEHETWSFLIFFSFIPVLLAFSLGFWGMNGTSRWVTLYGFLVCAIDVIFLATVLSDGQGAIMEWFSVLSYLIWVLLVSLDVLKRSRAESLVRVRQLPSSLRCGKRARDAGLKSVRPESRMLS